MTRIFLISPANCGGLRARQLLADGASFELARRLRTTGAPLGEAFAFMSGLYFRGKLTYALRYAARGQADAALVAAGVFVITPGAGLRTPDTIVTRAAIRRFAQVDVAAGEPKYRRPLEEAVTMLVRTAPDAEFVLLGSVATPKYVDVLAGILGERLLFPAAFVGRGDMSRGGLLLRHAASGVELEYVPVLGSVRRGRRPPKLEPLSRPPA